MLIDTFGELITFLGIALFLGVLMGHFIFPAEKIIYIPQDMTCDPTLTTPVEMYKSPVPVMFYPPYCNNVKPYYSASRKEVCIPGMDFLEPIVGETNSMSPILVKGHQYFGRKFNGIDAELGNIMNYNKFGANYIHSLAAKTKAEMKVQGYQNQYGEVITNKDVYGITCGVIFSR